MSEAPDARAILEAIAAERDRTLSLEAENARLRGEVADLQRTLDDERIRRAPGLYCVTCADGVTSVRYVQDLPDPVAFAAIAQHAEAIRRVFEEIDCQEESSLQIRWAEQEARWHRPSVSARTELLLELLAAALGESEASRLVDAGDSRYTTEEPDGQADPLRQGDPRGGKAAPVSDREAAERAAGVRG
jgi:hypothetical protein